MKDSPRPSPADNPCHCFALRRAARTVSREYSEVMGPIGLKHTQFSLLAILSYGEQQSISTLAELLGLERTSLTRTLRPLESQRLVERTDEGYRRQKMIRITAAGMEKYEQGLPLWQAAQARRNARLTGDERAQLHALLDLAQGV